MTRVFVDGQSGTTGIRIRERLSVREDIELITLNDSERKDPAMRKDALNSCDIAFLCLPDDAAKEAVALVENPNVVILDASTAHRTSSGWTYGFPELSREQYQRVASSKRITVPGCHATGFIALVTPLLRSELISPTCRLVCHSLTGYSGGGKKMISEYQDQARSWLLDSPRQYAISQQHKHLKEMVAISGLAQAPIFCPIVADFYSGMEVTVCLFREDLQPGFTAADVRAVYRQAYATELVSFVEQVDESGFMASNALAGKDTMQISVEGNDDRILLVARFDNLGKGASGAAMQCMNIVLGKEQTLSLEL